MRHLVLGLFLLPAAALAQAPAPAPESCAKLEERKKTARSPAVLLELGDCYEKQGRAASAHAAFLDAEADAMGLGDKATQALAQKRAQAVAPLVTKLIVEVPEASRAAGLQIKRNGVPLAEDLWNIEVPIDPGKARIEATAPGRAGWSTDIELGAGYHVRVEVPPLAEGATRPTPVVTDREQPPPVTPTPAPTPVPAPAPPPVAERPDEGIQWTPRRIAAVSLAGGGVLALGVGTVLGLSAKSKWDDAEGMCSPAPDNCQPGAPGLADDAGLYADLATVSFVVGAAAIGAGAYLWFTAPAEESKTAVRVAPGPRGAVVLVERSF